MKRTDDTFKKIWFKSYSIFLSIMLLFSISFIRKVLTIMTKKQTAIYVLVMTFTGYAWTLTSNNIAEEPAWAFSKLAFFGIELCNMILEDYLFYPINAFFFLVIMYFFRNIKDFTFNKQLIIPVYLVLIALFSMLDFMGFLVSVFFIIPGLIFIMNKNVFEAFNTKVFLYLNIILNIFSFIWDLNSTYFRAIYFDKAGVQWYYPKNNIVSLMDSNMFSNINWAWILDSSPISITPYFSIAGIFFAYALYLKIKNL
jgi:hypothetical protein